MIILRGHPSRGIYFPVDGALTDIQEGAVVMPGVTDETDRSVAIIASGAAADAIGLLSELHDALATTDADPEGGTIAQTEEAGGRGTGGSARLILPFLPGCQVAAEMANDADNDVDVASATSTVLTITNLEDDIEGSWIYVRAGTGVGQLAYATASASGSITIKNATGLTTLDNTSKVLIMRRRFHQTCALNGTTNPATRIASSAAAGSLPWRVIHNEFRRPGYEGWIMLDPKVHHGLTGLNVTGFALRQILSPSDTFFNPLD